jgi:hypothetical protein
MNPTDEHPPEHLPTLDDRRFDLLVDGELPEAERRNLLSTLDDLPGGWRRCALAFLEAQSWKDEMGGMRRETVSAPPSARSAGRSGFPRGTWGTLLAMATCFLVALALGLALDAVWQSDEGLPSAPIQVAVDERAPETEPVVEPLLDADPALPAPAAPPDDQWQFVTVPVGPSRDGARSIRVPARQRDRIDSGWPGQFAPMVPDDVLQAFQRSGHQMRRNRRLMPFDLDDGRRVIVPFEEVEFHYVGNSAYQ